MRLTITLKLKIINDWGYIMNKIKILADSGCDLDQDYTDKIGVEILPFLVELDGVTYLDRQSLTPREYFKLLSNTKSQAFTAQVTPIKFEDTFKKYLDQGYEVVYIGMSSTMTGTFHSACVAQRSLGSDSVHVFDSKGGSTGYGFLVDIAAKMVSSGCTVDELFAKLQHMKDYLVTYLTVGDLGRLRASGRLSKGAAIVGEIFNIIPILKLVNGNVAVQEKVRGPKSVIKYMMKEMEEKGDRISDQVIPLAYADEQGYELCMMLKKAIEDKYGVKDFFITEVGMSIGSHTGSGAIGCFFLQKEVVE